MSLAGKICVVTGASKGIGKGIALQLGKNSAKVYITGRSKDKLESCAHEIEQWGGKVHRFSGRATRGARRAIAPPAFRNCHIKMQ